MNLNQINDAYNVQKLTVYVLNEVDGKVKARMNEGFCQKIREKHGLRLEDDIVLTLPGDSTFAFDIDEIRGSEFPSNGQIGLPINLASKLGFSNGEAREFYIITDSRFLKQMQPDIINDGVPPEFYSR